MAVNPNELPRCGVKGLVAPRAMCACVMMGGRCGTKGPCPHKIEAKPATSLLALRLRRHTGGGATCVSAAPRSATATR